MQRITMEMLEEEGLDNGLTQGILDDYMESLQAHIAYVQEACYLLGGMSAGQIAAHDLSKFSMAEFPHYARQFKGPANDPDGFAYAWLHHIHNNPHHWQHWIFPDGFTPRDSKVENGVMQMPHHFVLEMVADWMGASKVYTGTWDMSDWLLKNLPKIRVHSQTAASIERILTTSAYYHNVFIQLRANNVW